MKVKIYFLSTDIPNPVTTCNRTLNFSREPCSALSSASEQGTPAFLASHAGVFKGARKREEIRAPLKKCVGGYSFMGSKRTGNLNEQSAFSYTMHERMDDKQYSRG